MHTGCVEGAVQVLVRWSMGPELIRKQNLSENYIGAVQGETSQFGAGQSRVVDFMSDCCSSCLNSQTHIMDHIAACC